MSDSLPLGSGYFDHDVTKYKKNNIHFRIVSAAAIAEFKKSQSESFLQVVRKDLSLCECTREMVLLEFERMSQFIFGVERIFLNNAERYLPPAVKNVVIELLNREFNKINEIMIAHPEVFPRKMQNYAQIIHEYALSLISVNLETLLTNRADNAFKGMVECLIKYLQHVLIAAHEYDNNIVKGHAPFISYCRMSPDSPETVNILPVIARTHFFMSNGTIPKFVIKNYSGDDVGTLFLDLPHLIPDVEFLPEDQLFTDAAE